MNILNPIIMRTSIRSYRPQGVEKEKLDAIIQAGNMAPVFGQFHITVIENPKLLEEIDCVTLDMMRRSGNEFLEKRAAMEGYRPLYGAPVLIILSALNGNDSNGFNMANVSCAAENMIIEATELGLGTCFVMGPMISFSQPELMKKLEIPKEFVPLAGVLAGYPEKGLVKNSRKNPQNITYLK